MEIRMATESDSDVLLELLYLKADFDRSMGSQSTVINNNAQKLKRSMFGDHPVAFALLAEQDNQIAGLALYHLRYSSFSGDPSLWLDDLYLREDVRSQGIGLALMNQLKSSAEAIGSSHISWAAALDNKRGQAFYNRLGAKIEKTQGNGLTYRWDL